MNKIVIKLALRNAVFFSIGLLFTLGYLRAEVTKDNAFIKEVAVDPNALPDGVNMTAPLMLKFLTQAFKEQKLGDPNFKSDTCLKVKDLGTGDSYNTLQLFQITSTCTGINPVNFVIKEARSGLKEAVSFHEISQYPGVKELMELKNPPANNISLALPVAYLSYIDKNGEKHYLSLMPFAPGKMLCQIVRDYRDNQTDQKAEQIKLMYSNMGKQLANFQRKFMKPKANAVIGNTLVHTDLHCMNVFFDKDSQRTTWIDLEDIQRFLKERGSPFIDIFRTFMGLYLPNETWERKNMIEGIPENKWWFDLAFRPFIKSYSEAYGKDKKRALKELKAIFNQNPLPGEHFNLISIEELKKLRDNFINPILDEEIKKAE